MYFMIPFVLSSGIGKTNLLGRKSEHKFPLERWEEGSPGKGCEINCRYNGQFCIFMMVWVTQVYTFVKIHQMVPLVLMHFMLCKFYFRRWNSSKQISNSYKWVITLANYVHTKIFIWQWTHECIFEMYPKIDW